MYRREITVRRSDVIQLHKNEKTTYAGLGSSVEASPQGILLTQ